MRAIQQIKYVSIILGILSLASMAMAQDTMTLNTVGKAFTMGNVYVSPYTGTVKDSNGNVLYTGNVICDDFSTDSYLNNPWSVTASTVENLSGEKFGGSENIFVALANGQTDYLGSYSAQASYNAAAWLAVQLLMPSNMNDSTQASEYSFAIWTIFNGQNAFGNVTGINGLTQTAVQQAVVNDIQNAFSSTSNGYNGPTVTVYTPSPLSASQEFLVVQTPEAPVWANLGMDFGVLLGAFFVLRRRFFGAKSISPS